MLGLIRAQVGSLLAGESRWLLRLRQVLDTTCVAVRGGLNAARRWQILLTLCQRHWIINCLVLLLLILPSLVLQERSSSLVFLTLEQALLADLGYESARLHLHE